MGSQTSCRRRAVLSGAAGALVATSGCLGEVRNLAGRDRATQLSLSIATLPASEDPYAVRIANRLADTLEAAGIDTLVDPIRPDVLFRDVLINHDFDIYVARYPSQGEPDELRSMLYSTYAEESGWQNPFGFSNLSFDELLDKQRAVGESDRVETVHEIQRELLREQPFTVVCFPDYIGAVRNDRFEGWPGGGLKQPADYLRLDRVGEETTLQLLLRNGHITRNRNPIAAEYRDQGYLIELIYDPLLRTTEDAVEPIEWLAETISWDTVGRMSATVAIRENFWHDGEPVTAGDVAFTYEFLQDTSLGEFDTPVPTPWRRGRLSLAESIEVLDDRQLRIEFTTTNRSIARRLLTVPILPEHIWKERTDAADIAGIDLVGQTTEALVDSNEDTIGSGPLRFVEATTDGSLSLETFDDHFIYTGHDDGVPDRLKGGPSFDRLEFTIVPSHDAAIQILEDDGADAIADGLQASVVPRIIRSDDISLRVRSVDSFYHLGYNCRRAPLSDPNFRRAIARHVDRDAVVSESLSGYGTPTEAPMKDRWVPEDLQWDGEATLPFLETDGEFDAERARETFRDAGYQYDGDQLVRRGG